MDALIGSTTTPGSIAMVRVAAETKTPLFAMGAGAAIVQPMDDQKKWVFKAVHNDSMMVEAIVEHMKTKGVKKIGYIGFADATGEGYLNILKPLAKQNGIDLTAVERYERTDTSVTAQILKIIAKKPDAIFIAAFGTPAALPQRSLADIKYPGIVYQTHGVANNDFLRVAGTSAEGVFLPVGPLLVSDQLPANHPSKRIGLEVVKKYEDKYGQGTKTTFISNAYDAYLLIESAVKKTLQNSKPGSEKFREDLRNNLENTHDFAGTQGIYNMTSTDHVGLDQRSRVMVQIVDGKWKVVGNN